MDALQLSTTAAPARPNEHPKACAARLLQSFSSSASADQIAARVALARVNGVDDAVSATLARPMCSLKTGEDRALAVLCIGTLLDQACRLSGVTRQPSEEELRSWAQHIVGGPDWGSLPLAALIDFARQLATGRWTLYDRLTMAQVGEYLRQYAAEWRKAYMAHERALHDAKLAEQQRAKAEQAKAEYEQIMADPERRAEAEAEVARLKAEMQRHAEAEAKRLRLLTPEQRARIEAERWQAPAENLPGPID